MKKSSVKKYSNAFRISNHKSNKNAKDILLFRKYFDLNIRSTSKNPKI